MALCSSHEFGEKTKDEDYISCVLFKNYSQGWSTKNGTSCNQQHTDVTLSR